jgi:hypothetical protein
MGTLEEETFRGYNHDGQRDESFHTPDDWANVDRIKATFERFNDECCGSTQAAVPWIPILDADGAPLESGVQAWWRWDKKGSCVETFARGRINVEPKQAFGLYMDPGDRWKSDVATSMITKFEKGLTIRHS